MVRTARKGATQVLPPQQSRSLYGCWLLKRDLRRSPSDRQQFVARTVGAVVVYPALQRRRDERQLWQTGVL